MEKVSEQGLGAFGLSRDDFAHHRICDAAVFARRFSFRPTRCLRTRLGMKYDSHLV